jgi:hypothetical protein
LLSTVVITGYPYLTTETLDQDAAATWLRARARAVLRVEPLQRHHHVAVVLAATHGWSPDASASGCLTFCFHRYGPEDGTDETSEYWKIDVIERE